MPFALIVAPSVRCQTSCAMLGEVLDGPVLATCTCMRISKTCQRIACTYVHKLSYIHSLHTHTYILYVGMLCYVRCNPCHMRMHSYAASTSPYKTSSRDVPDV